MDQVPSASRVGWTWWKVVSSRLTTMRCRSRSWIGVNVVDGLAVLVLDGEPEGAAVGVEVGGGGDEAVALGGGDDALADRGGGFGLGLGDVGADGGADARRRRRGWRRGRRRSRRGGWWCSSGQLVSGLVDGGGDVGDVELTVALDGDGAGGDVDGDAGDAGELGRPRR